ncbi:Alpha/Beta hydrolase protein, partial [Microdochium trichocladiopsis]
RKYGIWLPPSYDPTVPNPVILAFHGGGGNSTMQEPVSELHRPEFNRRGYIAVYPESTEEYAGRMWEVSPAIALRGVDDMGYVAALLEHIKQELCVDETRIYATGMSQGGGMANMLACHPVLSTQIAAFAAVSGSYFYNGDPHCHPRDDILPCKPGRKGIPIMAFHGAGDETIRYGGGLAEKHYACTPALDYWAAEWARRNG